ncbi:hypothetical protein PPERSA_06926 [Pseudocohnilembus persalinus]|uniref:Uncharacterized protein n=1 Tax=Pseudocohnilembus persalinus TaxID=266149 RepID=A0A0V0QY81_PSEPJ|nr:hypothetical protein PPERSA_06926 [Pseudocohnilembus persalinus]|eukprot:KRX07311.1 hypothetical protein PPERSA_06926 [Pseudocohnilembus persalinus]
MDVKNCSKRSESIVNCQNIYKQVSNETKVGKFQDIKYNYEEINSTKLQKASKKQIQQILYEISNNNMNLMEHFIDQYEANQVINDEECIIVGKGIKFDVKMIVSLDLQGNKGQKNKPGVKQMNGYRIDHQKQNIDKTANFQIQTNGNTSQSIAEIHIPQEVPIQKSVIKNAFIASLQQGKPYIIIIQEKKQDKNNFKIFK